MLLLYIIIQLWVSKFDQKDSLVLELAIKLFFNEIAREHIVGRQTDIEVIINHNTSYTLYSIA